jgi:hypothetical protein
MNMNMKNISRFLILPALTLIVWSSCSKDLGNYDYTNANVISITTDIANVDPKVVVTNDSIVVKQNDSLKVNILISQTKPSNDLVYEWMITQNAASISNPSQYVVGNAQQLRTKIILAPNLYRLVIKVTDKTTGISFYKTYSLNVDTSPWGGEGWLVLQDQPSANGCDISVITSRDGVARGNVYSNVYSLANNGNKLPVGTNKIAIMNYGNTLRIQKVAFFYPNGGLQVRSTDYLDSSNHTAWFAVTPNTVNIQSNSVAPIVGQYETLINNGQLYSQAVNATSIKTPPIRFGAPLLGSWPSLSPYFMMNANGGYCTFFDRVNKCFLHINMSNNTLIPTTQADVPNQHWPAYSGTGGAAVNLNPTTGKGYDLNNIGRDLIYTENAQIADGASINPAYYCIFRNATNDSTFMYQFNSGSTGIANNLTTGRYFLKDATTNVPGINTASIFGVPAFSSAGVSNVFYYVPGNSSNKIYVCNPSYTGTLPATTTAHQGYSFPAGTIIKSMKVFKSGYTTAPTTEGRVLVVATDETANSNGNNIYFFNLTAVGEINSTPSNVYTGFDKIIDIAFKKGLGF